MTDVGCFEQMAGERGWRKQNQGQAEAARAIRERSCKGRRWRWGLLLILLALSVLTSCASASRQAESIVVSYAPFQTLALLWAADEQGFFEQNGLDVTLREYTTGVASLDSALTGEADIAVGPSEFAVVGQVLNGKSVRILGCIDKVELVAVVARRDRGIAMPLDLQGQVVGTTVGTVSEFYLGRFLELNGLSMQDVTVVDLKTPPEWVNAVVDGDVDAVVTAQPYADSARDGLGDKAVVWPAQGGQPMFALLVSSEEWVAAHPDEARKFLKALKQAEDYVLRDPDEAKAMVQRRLNLATSALDVLWAQDRYELSLDLALVTAMEDEARWMLASDRRDNPMPDVLDYIDEGALRAVKPEAVTIIR